MRYVMRQRFLSLTDDYVIRDQTGRECFQVVGKFFSIGHSLSFRDMSGREVLEISQKLLAWGPTYEITRGGALVAIVKKELFTFFACRFEVDVPGPDDLIADGDLLDMEYAFLRGDETIGVVSKQWFSWTDTYGVEVADGEDDALILASAVVIDLACHHKD